MTDLRPYQQKAIHDVIQALRQGEKRIMLQAATGAGKTRIAGAMLQSVLRQGKRAIFTVPAISLVDQTVQSFHGLGIADIGVLQANHPMTAPHRRMQVASLQTLRRREVPPCDFWLIDEAHRQDKGLQDILSSDEWAGVPFVGLSATPWTKGLGRYWNRLIIAATTSELIEQGFLSPFRVFAPSAPDLANVGTVGDDYNQGQLSKASRKVELIGDVVSTWLRLGKGRPTLCFAVDCAHAQDIAKAFEAAGVRCGYQDAHTSDLDRADIRRKFHNGDLEVVCNVGTLTTGVDWDVRCIILARATKSEMLYVQIIGRGLRTAKGKEDCLILDHSGTTERLGFVTDIYYDSLDDGTMSGPKAGDEREKPLPKKCPKCSAMKPAGVRKCPECGFEPVKQSTVHHHDGELVELSSRRTSKENREWDWAQKVAFIASLRRMGQDRGYAPGWAAAMYREKLGVWPNDPRVKDVPPGPYVADWVAAWVRSRLIAYARAKKAANA